MIKVTLTTGPYAGQARTTDGVLAGVSPFAVLNGCLQHSWEWTIDYSAATHEEAHEWGIADLSVRCVRALTNGLPVYFDGVMYEGVDMVGDLEDAIVDSSKLVRVERDDEDGVVIGIGGWTQ